MKKGKRIIALLLAVLMIATSDTGIYQAFGMDAASPQSETGDAAGQDGQATENGTQDENLGQEQGSAGDTASQEGVQPEGNVQEQPSDQGSAAADGGNDAAGNIAGEPAAASNEIGGISTFATDSTQKIDLNAKVNNDLMATSVASGESFRYILGYNLPAFGSGATYNAVTIKIPLPDHISVVEDSSQNWDMAVTGQKIARVRMSKVDGVNTLNITLDTGLNAGQGSDISIMLKTENFQMADGTRIVLNPTMEGTAGGVTVTGSIEEANRPVVTVDAKDGWKVSKSVNQESDVRISNDAKSYEATYTIKVDSTKANFNSNGRMAVTDYLLTDILPTLAASGSYDGYPDGGQPFEVVAVTMGGQPLAGGTDYSVIKEGDAVKSLQIHTYKKATQADVADYPNITEDSMMPTTYTVTVKYHRNPYIVESNKVLNKWTLTNTAQLDYSLLGTAQVPSMDTAQIQLGEKEKAADPQAIAIKKYLQVGNELLPMDSDTAARFHTGSIAFKLYDEEGNPAVDIEGNALKDANGNKLTDSTMALGSDGTAVFQNLNRGTYYIEEIVNGDSGLSVPSGKIKVTVRNGQVTLEDAGGYTAELEDGLLKIVNTTEKYGMVQFYKYGKNASGIVGILKGVEFALTLPGDDTPKYTAVSESDGRVRFQGVEPGLYEIREISVGDNEEYVAAAGVIGTVTVTAGELASPAFASSEPTGPLAKPGYVNISPKGRFQLEKTDEKDNTITGSAATFQIYGPFETEQGIAGLTDIPQEWMQKLVTKPDGSAYEMSTSNGKATSIALDEGYYVLKEVKEPDGYAAIDNGMAQVQVTANTSDTKLVVKNTPKIKVRFLKEGKVGNVTVTDSSQLTGAEFEIWDSASGGTCLYGGEAGNQKGTLGTKLITAIDGTGNPYTKYAELAPGTYYYIETKAPDGFQTPGQDARVEFTVSRGEETKDITVVNTADYGRIKIIKKDSHSGQTLAGAKFQVFKDSACKQPVTDSKGNPVVLASADNGIAYSPLLPKGTYWIKETKAPAGHVMSGTVIQADVGENQENEIEVDNDPQVSLKILKTDAVTGNVVTGGTASFRLKTQSEGGAWQWVQASPAVTKGGVVVFTGLMPGKAYQIYEFKSPEGYVPADLANGKLMATVTMPAIGAEGYNEDLIYSTEVKNVPLGTYKIQKTTDFDGNGANVPLSGAVFELYKCGDTPNAEADCTGKNLVSAQTTDENGNAQWTGLLPGEYWLKEVKADGHQLMSPNPIQVTVKPGQNVDGYADLEQQDTIHNMAEDGKVAISKADAANQDIRLAKVTFHIYKKEAGVTDYSDKEVIATLTTDAEGNAVSGWLKPGEYVLVEQKLPDELSGYERDTTPREFTVTAGKTSRTYQENPIVNKKMGKLFIDKVAKFAVSGADFVTYPLSGAQIRIYKCTGDGNKEADIQKTPVLNTFTMAGGSWESGLLPEGDYWIEEVYAPEGYHLNGTDQATTSDLNVRVQNTYKVSVASGETTKTDANHVTIENETKRGKLRVNKTSPEGRPLKGAEFTIYREVSEEEYQAAPADQRETVAVQGKTVYLLKAKVSESSDASGSMMQTDEKGTAATTTLKAGDAYWLKETKAPDGYYMGQEWYGPYVVEEGKETVVPVVNYPKTPIEGQKTDANKAPLSGAYMAVYSSAADARIVNQYLRENQYETDAGKRAALKTVLEKKKKNPDYQFTGIYEANGFNKILQIAVSQADGRFSFSDLAPGTYYVAEALPPDGYAYEFDTISTLEVSIGDNGEIVYSPVTVANHLMGYLTATKVTVIGNKEYPVSGVKYNVYAAKLEKDQYVKTGAVLYTGYTDENGMFKSVLLPAGHYIIEEADADEYTEAAHPAPTIIEIGSADEGKIPESGYYHAEVKEDETTDAGKFVNTAKVGKFTLQKQVVNNGYVNKGDVTATFKLEKLIDSKTNEWEVVYEEIPVTVKENSSASDIYLSGDLEAGTYRISETRMPGYTVNASVIQFEIRPGQVTGMDGNKNIIYGSEEDSPIVFSNDHKGYLTIRKAGEYVNDKGELVTNPLSNVTFELYSRVSEDRKSDCVKDNLIGTRSTSSGNISNWELDAGNYWLVESSVGNNAPEYAAGGIEEAMPITVEIGKTLQLTGDQKIINKSSYGRFKVKKVDANDGAGLSGAKFEIYTKKADGSYKKYSNTELTTGADGTVVTGLLPQGEYYLKETQSPSGYEKAASDKYYGPYAVTSQSLADYSNDGKGQIANKKYFTVQIEKVAAADGSPLAGAVFGLYDSEEAANNGTLENTPDERKGTTKIQGSGDSQKAIASFEKLLLEDAAGKAIDSRTFYVKELKAPAVSGEEYLQDETIYPVTVAYNKDQAVVTLGDPIKNDRKGKIGIVKEGTWTDTSGITGIEKLEGAEFQIYAVENCGDSPGSTPSGNLITGTDGAALSEPLDAGWYAIKETKAPAGYGTSDTLYWFEVKDNEIATTYYAESGQGGYVSSDAAIQNGAKSGRFLLKKYDGNAGEPEENLTALSGAVFKLYQKAEDGTWKLYKDGSAQKDTFEVSQSGYTSWYLPYGEYKIQEDMQQSKPYYTYTENNINYTIRCAPSQEEITFTINEENAGRTLPLKAHNSPKGSIHFTKYGDTNNNGQIDAGDEKLEGATFRLYTDQVCKTEALGGDSLRTTDAQGLCAWDSLAPGTYYIKETQEGKGTVEAAGYEVMEEAVEVTVAAGLTINAVKQDPDLLKSEATMLDASGAGRIRVKKTDKDGNSLAGAEFKIYRKSTDTWVDTQMTVTTTDSADGTLSGLLKADAGGTEYKVVEVKAPAGFTLDDRFYDLEKTVTVLPNHVPEAEVNLVSFTNKKADEVQGFQANVEKAISDDDESYTDEVTSSQSLMEEKYDYHVDFKVDGYADGSNEVGASEFVVTDNDIKLYSKTTKEMEGTDYNEMKVTTDAGNPVIKDYRMNSVTLGHSWNDSSYNADIKDKRVGAKVYVQTTLAQKEKNEWPSKPYKEIEDLSPQEGVKVEFGKSEHVIGVKVEYTNVLAGFNSDGIQINATFLNRSWSSQEINELRRISNQASITWKDSQLDESGDPLETDAHKGNKVSQTVYAKIPSYVEKLPAVRITNTIQNQKNSGFFSGEDIKYQVKAENVEVQDQEEVFKEPVISVRMPAETTLVQSTSSLASGFSVYYRSRSGQLITIPSTSFDIVASDVHPYVSIDEDGNYVEDEKRMTKQYTFVFKDFELGEGEQIFIDFTGTISYAPKTDIKKLVCPAYLSSNYTLPPTVENEKGLSYKPAAENSAVTEEPVIDAAVDKELEYLNQPTEAAVSSATSVQLVKEISTDRSLWGSSVSVNAGDQVYYKLTLYNNSDNFLSEVRLTDILPFNGDKMTLTGTNRGTTTPASDDEHDEMTLASVEAAGTSGGTEGKAVEAHPTVYYYAEQDAYANSWAGKAPGTDEGDGALKMLYSAEAAGSVWSDGWTTAKPDERNISAVGVNVTFDGEGLQPGDSYEVVLVMNAPEYTVEQMSEYNGKVMVNSAASAVILKGASGGTIPSENRTEPNSVVCTLNLPTGSIGDYVWFDANQDGIQNDTRDAEGREYDPGLNGITVKLHQKITYRANGQIQSRDVVLKTTETRSKEGDGGNGARKGYYEFTDLPCNYLENGKTDRTDPDNYIGNEYYSYYVEFVLPDGSNYTPTVKYANAGERDETDSNANPDGTTDPVELWVSRDQATGKLQGEKRTDIDAGLVNAYAIGDYVWEDANSDGVQNEDEKGVKGVSVRLYQVEGKDGRVEVGDAPIASTVTDDDGHYQFNNLLQGYYVVEFDTSTLTYETNDSGYAYRYDFTKVQKVDPEGQTKDYSRENNSDSDAQEDVDKEGRIRRTRTIRLTKNDLTAAGIQDNKDDRWDAGLVEYSALGGFVFDDADYNDLHLDSLNIPLSGTKVALYKIDASGNREKDPIAETVVRDNGRYYFDHLLIPDGTYQDYAVRFEYPEGYVGVQANQDPDGDNGAFDTKTANDSTIDSDVNEFSTVGGATNRRIGYIRQIRLYPATVSTTWDAGARKYSAIGDYVWIDANKNGLQDRTETPIAGVRVVLQSRDDRQSPWKYAGETATDENGYYIFKDLESSEHINKEYRVVFALEPTRKVTTLNVSEGNKASTNDSDAIGKYEAGIIDGTLLNPQSTGGYVTVNIKPGYGEEDMTWDCGVIPVLSALGDYVWYDDDYNGIQDPGEKGVPNVKVSLEYNESGRTGDNGSWVEVRTTYTDEDGYYWFAELNPGYYRVRYYIPDGYRSTKYNRGTGDNGNAVDSDASRRADENSYYSRHFYLDEDTQDPTWDAGIYKPQTRVVRKTTRRTTTRRRSRRSRSARTGDVSSLALYALILAASGGTAGTLYWKKKKKKGV